MPFYQYECDSCEHSFEELQKMKDPFLKQCPKCGDKKLRKLFGVPALIFKGTGFYATDYKNKDGPPIKED